MRSSPGTCTATSAAAHSPTTRCARLRRGRLLLGVSAACMHAWRRRRRPRRTNRAVALHECMRLPPLSSLWPAAERLRPRAPGRGHGRQHGGPVNSLHRRAGGQQGTQAALVRRAEQGLPVPQLRATGAHVHVCTTARACIHAFGLHVSSRPCVSSRTQTRCRPLLLRPPLPPSACLRPALPVLAGGRLLLRPPARLERVQGAQLWRRRPHLHQRHARALGVAPRAGQPPGAARGRGDAAARRRQHALQRRWRRQAQRWQQQCQRDRDRCRWQQPHQQRHCWRHQQQQCQQQWRRQPSGGQALAAAAAAAWAVAGRPAARMTRQPPLARAHAAAAEEAEWSALLTRGVLVCTNKSRGVVHCKPSQACETCGWTQHLKLQRCLAAAQSSCPHLCVAAVVWPIMKVMHACCCRRRARGAAVT